MYGKRCGSTFILLRLFVEKRTLDHSPEHLFSISIDHILNTQLPKLTWILSHVCLVCSSSLPPAHSLLLIDFFFLLIFFYIGLPLIKHLYFWDHY